MSTNEQALASVLSQLAFSCDGAVLGVALAYAAVRTVIKFSYASKALRRLRNAPFVEIADLRSVLDQSQPSDARLIVVRGTVEAKSAVDGGWNFLKPGVLVSEENDRAVIIQRTQTCIYHEWKGFLGWQSDLRAIISRFWREQQSKSFKTVPFILVEGGRRTISDFVAVNLDGSKHPLPLATGYHSLTAVPVPNYSFVQCLFGHSSPFGLLDEEKILPVGKEVSAVGHCTVKNGVPEIKSSKDLPYFLSDMSKDQMVLDLESQKKTLFWSAIVIGSMSVAALGYAAVRKWNRWKVSQQMETLIAGNVHDNDEREVEEDENAGDVPEGQLCVVCLMRRKRSAFIPCGHLVCCQPCSIAIELELAPKCPVCRQDIRTSVRIYDS